MVEKSESKSCQWEVWWNRKPISPVLSRSLCWNAVWMCCYLSATRCHLFVLLDDALKLLKVATSPERRFACQGLHLCLLLSCTLLYVPASFLLFNPSASGALVHSSTLHHFAELVSIEILHLGRHWCTTRVILLSPLEQAAASRALLRWWSAPLACLRLTEKTLPTAANQSSRKKKQDCSVP